MFTCSKCGSVETGNTKVVEIEESFPVKGEATSIKSTVRLCADCDEPVYDRELDSANLIRAFDSYRAKHGIMGPAAIRTTREAYGLTQRSFSNLLGMGEVTIHRYESGSIPDDAHNELLVLTQDPVKMRDILEMWGDKIPASQRAKAADRLEAIIAADRSGTILGLAAAKVSHHGPDIYTGFLPFQPEKLMDMALFCAAKLEGVYKTKLNKLLWYSDFMHYRHFGVSVSGAPYIHLPFGPCADQYDYFLGYLLQEEKLKSTEVFFGAGSGEELSALVDVEGTFPSSAVEVMTAVCHYFGGKSSKEVSEMSHNEEGYTNTVEGQTISYSYADSLIVNLETMIPSLAR